MYVLDGDGGVDAEKPDEVDRVGPHLPGQQSDLVEGGPQGKVAELWRCRMPI
ncbi:hypothetical protein ACFWBR_39745 [Streptomyces sp. NPDC060006]|uniref:hypothetical protein n=1 Tax=unclassified Streptomyces TaxID=2593676 RepID=UPI0036282E70